MQRFTLMLMVVFSMALSAQQKDDFLWLEDVTSKRSLAWVEDQNKISAKQLESDVHFKKMKKTALNILNSNDRFLEIEIIGKLAVNLWQDTKNIQGVLRTQAFSDYLQGKNNWTTVLDLDALSKADGKKWVYKGISCLKPAYEKCLLSLSNGGGDAVEIKEFNLKSGSFVLDGFQVPEGKSYVHWYNENQIYIGYKADEDSVTQSGYPRTMRVWSRGEELSAAKPIFIGKKSDLGTWVESVQDIDGEKTTILTRWVDFFTQEILLLNNKKIRKLRLPLDVELLAVNKSTLLVQFKKDGEFEGDKFSQGELVTITTKQWSENVDLKATSFFKPTKEQGVDFVTATKHGFFVKILENVNSKILFFLRQKSGEYKSEVVKLPKNGSIDVIASCFDLDQLIVDFKGFLTPSTRYQLVRTQRIKIKSLKPLFDAADFKVSQKFATSKDGTKIPYYFVSKKNLALDSTQPVLLYGYGGFEVSLTPFYSGIYGKLWLEQGGALAVANIRGGGEFGPKWHQAALKKNRHKAYDDFIAVSKDLIDTKVTSPQHLGVFGGSNGGLLVGAVSMRAPELYNAVICAVPLLDMMRYTVMKDATGRTTGVSWVGEYGDPADADMKKYIKTYSPYQNIKQNAQYPEIFFMTSTKDDRVHPGHARKMAAKMLDSGHDVLYYENTNGGHGGASNNTEKAHGYALRFTYLMQKLF